jgi:ABC-type transport system involved in multi-copper enzyme maturation permease subunit
MNNPVLNREIKLLFRQPRLLERVWLGWGLLAVVIVVLWPASGVFSGEDSSSRWIFRCFALGQLLLCILVAPSITAPLITDEKEHDRFGMLFASLLSPFDVLMGKWLSSIAILMLMLLSGFPFLVLVIVLGGVSWIEVMQVYLVSLVALLQFGTLGLFISCIKDKTYDALLSSYAWLLILGALTWLPSYLLSGFTALVPLWALLRCLSPFAAMIDIVAPEVLVYLGRLPSEFDAGELWRADLWVYLVLAILSATLLFLLALKKVFLLPLGREGSSRSEVNEKKKKFPYILINPDKTRRPFGVSSLIFIKELRCKMFGHMGNLIRGIYVGLFVSIGLVILVSLNVDTLSTDGSFDAVRLVAVIFQMSMILLLTPALTASAVSEEIQSGTLEMLRMTPVSAWKFWLGKVKAGNFYMLILLGSSFPIYGMLALLDSVMGGDMLVVLRVIALQALLLFFTSTCGVWCSAITEHTQKAVGLAYAILFTLAIVPFTFPSFFENVTFLNWICALSPFFVAISEVSLKTYKDLQLFIPHIIVLGGISGCMLVHSLWIVRRLMRQAA